MSVHVCTCPHMPAAHRKCEAGTEQPSAGAGSCNKCPKGTYHYKGPIFPKCMPCPGGYYAPREGGLRRSSTAAFHSSAWQPLDVRPWSFPFAGVALCLPCPSGFYSPITTYDPSLPVNIGPISCTPCPVGTTSRPGSKDCSPCPLGEDRGHGPARFLVGSGGHCTIYALSSV